MIIPTEKKLKKRDEYDYYPTPIGLCRQALTILPSSFYPFSVFDPGCGNGVWGEAVRELYRTCFIGGIELRKVEINPAFNYLFAEQDYLEDYWNPWERPQYDLIIGNPPYKLAENFIDRSLELVNDNGNILFLFRLAFLESLKRYNKYWTQNKPVKVAVLVNRISFTGDKKSDDTAYALYLFKKNNIENTELTWLKWR